MTTLCFEGEVTTNQSVKSSQEAKASVCLTSAIVSGENVQFFKSAYAVDNDVDNFEQHAFITYNSIV